MKLLRYGNPGAERPGLLDASGRVRDLSAHVGDIAGEALTPSGFARLRSVDPASLPLVEGEPQRDLRLGPCVGTVGKFICIGLNYADHAAETNSPIRRSPSSSRNGRAPSSAPTTTSRFRADRRRPTGRWNSAW